MVQLQRYLKRTNDFQTYKNLPLLNSLFIERFTQLNPYSKDNDFKTYMRWVRRSPSLLGFLKIIVNDILSDSIEFTPVEKNVSGRNKVLKADKFFNANNGHAVIEEMCYDLFTLGIGYNWIGKISNFQLKELCDASVKEVFSGVEKKELEYKAQIISDFVKKDNADTLAKKWRCVAASTMSPQTDEYEVLKYTQRVGVNFKEYSTDEIITFKFMPMDGKIFPFPPLECLLSEIYLLWLISQNYISFFENGGKPDNVFILPQELAGSKNHQYLIETLKKYKQIQNKHGNLVFTGNLSIERLMEVEHQMENKDLGLYLVGVLAQFYGVPVSRIPFLVGKAAAGGDAGGLADSGYWRGVSVWQSKIETPLNNNLWIPYFGVKMRFGRGYLQDEVRETQNEMQKTSVAEQRMRLGIWTVEAAGEYLKVDPEEIKKAQKQKEERMEETMKTGMLRQNLENDRNVIPNQDNRLKAKQKQGTQLANQQNAGGKRINP